MVFYFDEAVVLFDGLLIPKPEAGYLNSMLWNAPEQGGLVARASMGD
jgi:hypothetical protein